MSARARFVSVALGLLALGAAVAVAPRARAQERDELVRLLHAKEREAVELRAELAALQDLEAGFTRSVEQEKRRLLDRIAALEAQLAPDTPRVTARFREASIAQVASALGERGRCEVALDRVADGVTVTLNLRELPLPLALDLACDNAYGEDGEPAPLRWRRDGARVVIEAAR